MFILVLVCLSSTAHALNEKGPHIGYLYPAGGQQGAVVEVLTGGQFLNGVNSVLISGDGVRAKVLQLGKPLNNMEMQEVRKQLNELLKQRRAEASGKKAVNAKAEPITLPDVPQFRHVDKMGLKELEQWMAQFFNSNKKQMNAQLAELVVLEVTIDPGAATGDRELRLKTPTGLTNLLHFQVGAPPEVLEHEPNDKDAADLQKVDLPAVLNGQIMPGDVDLFRFSARRGQRLVIDAQARRLMPYLADAVPGWFQAALTLYDSKGKEMGFADHYRFDPDPVLLFEVPNDGEYTLEIRDSIYRGREDFVYRITVDEKPFITTMFPLGGRTGHKTTAKIEGWNLPKKRLSLDTKNGADHVREAALCNDKQVSNSMLYSVDVLPQSKDKKHNDSIKQAQRITLPRVINGRIEKPGDVDVFEFKGHAGDEVVAEVEARRLNSPLDSLLKLTDKSGRVLACNDDLENKATEPTAMPGTGLQTHQADSYLCAKLPENGMYYIHLADSENHGGKEYAYRLRISAPRPDFDLRVAPSTLNVHAGRTMPVWVYALRKDGYNGGIDLALKDAPAGFALDGAKIPAGRDKVRVTLTAPPKPLAEPVALHIEGRAQIAKQTVVRPAVPAEDMMQAFLYRHLVPSHDMMVDVTNRWRVVTVALADKKPVKVPVGGKAQVQLKVPKKVKIDDVQLELDEPPKGLTLQDVKTGADGLAFTLKADANATKAGFADNLIVEAFFEPAPPKNAKPGKQVQRVSLGTLPAIPIQIVKPGGGTTP